MTKLSRNLVNSDPKVANIIHKELDRLKHTILLIPSENYPSIPVIQALGSIFNIKYSEGYPKKRYYGGNEFCDEIEDLAIERAKKLFGAEHANVQPYSGSPANLSVFFALMNHNDKFMGLDLYAGGHLTHGSPVNFSGMLYEPVPYYVDKKTEIIDMDQLRKIAIKEKPKMIISGSTAYPREFKFREFQDIAEEIGAYHLADISHIAGLIVGKVHQTPFPFTDVVTTTTHKTLRGPRCAIIMSKIEDRLKDKYHKDSKYNLAQMIDKAVFPGTQGGPHENEIAAKAVCFEEAMKPEFKDYTIQIIKNAKALSEELMGFGLKLVSNGTDNHMMVIDLAKKGLVGKGKEIQDALEKCLIVTNRNTIPFEPSSPFKPSGIRIGTPAVTTRGMKEQEMKDIAKAIITVIDNHDNESIMQKVKLDMLGLSKQFPLYPELMD